MACGTQDVTAAMLVWLPDGQRALAEDFEKLRGGACSPPPPEVFRSFGAAVDQATSILEKGEHHEKRPWIRVGYEIFGPDQVSVASNTVRDIKGRSPQP
jgi:hypothetical protein